MSNKIGLFVSWSGDASKGIAQVLKVWLTTMSRELDVFFTPDDIVAGKRWSSELAHKLQECEIGIFVYTRQNLDSLWMAFEAGSLSKQIDTGRVIPLVFGAHVTDLKGPLSQFQARRFTYEEILKTLEAINSRLSDKRTKEELSDYLRLTWDKLEQDIKEILNKHERTEEEGRHDIGEVLDNIYSLVRTSPLYSAEFAEDISELVQQVKISHQDIAKLIQQVKTTLRGSYLFIDGEKPAFSALIAATMRAKKFIRSTRFSPMAISGNQDDYAQAIRSRVIGTEEVDPLERYTRIIAVNNPAKLKDIEGYLEQFQGRNLDLYLTKKSNSFELVIIDEEEVFIHFYGQGHVINSTLNIVGPEVTKNFINIYHQLHDPNYDPDILKVDFRYMREADKWRKQIIAFFEPNQAKFPEIP